MRIHLPLGSKKSQFSMQLAKVKYIFDIEKVNLSYKKSFLLLALTGSYSSVAKCCDLVGCGMVVSQQNASTREAEPETDAKGVFIYKYAVVC